MSRELIVKHPDIKKYTTIWMDTIRGGEFGLSNTNKLVRFYPGCTGLKTGFTSQAGYCLSATAQRDGMELIAVVMGCETSAKRLAACKSMLDHGFAGYAVVTPTLEQIPQVKVKLGVADSVNAIPGNQDALLIDKGQKNLITTQIQLEEEITAPVSQGQRLGTMAVKAGEQVLMEIPLVAESAVHKLSFAQVFKQVLRQLLGAK